MIIASIFQENLMAHLHFYIPDSVADKIKAKAEHAHLSVSKYLVELVKREVGYQWPDDYFEVFGKWESEPSNVFLIGKE